MDARDADAVLRASREFAAKGIIPHESLKRIEAECAAASDAGTARVAAEGTDGGVTLSQTLHALGGALLAAAAIAAVLVLFPHHLYQEGQPQAWTLAAMGGGATAVGFVMLRMLRNEDLADAFLVAGIACLTAMAMPSDEVGRYLAPLGLVACLAIPLARRGPMVAALASFGVALAGMRTFMLLLPESAAYSGNISDLGLGLWLTLSIVVLVAVAGGVWLMGQRWLGLALAAQAIAIVIPFVWFVEDVLDHGRSAFFDEYGGTQILLAAFEGILVAFAIARRDAPLLVAASLVISVDAVVFAFDVGGLQYGVVSLLLVAAAVLGLATYMRRKWNRPAPVRPAV